MNIIKKLCQKIKSHAQQGKSDWELVAWSIAWEGYVGVGEGNKYRRLKPVIIIGNTERELLEKMQKFAKGYGRIYGPQLKLKHKPMFIWQIYRLTEIKEVLENIVQLIPSTRKKEVVKLLLEFCNSRLTRFKKPYNDIERSIANKLIDLKPRNKN